MRIRNLCCVAVTVLALAGFAGCKKKASAPQDEGAPAPMSAGMAKGMDAMNAPPDSMEAMDTLRPMGLGEKPDGGINTVDPKGNTGMKARKQLQGLDDPAS